MKLVKKIVIDLLKNPDLCTNSDGFLETLKRIADPDIFLRFNFSGKDFSLKQEKYAGEGNTLDFHKSWIRKC
jgi:hypothetical protein